MANNGIINTGSAPRLLESGVDKINVNRRSNLVQCGHCGIQLSSSKMLNHMKVCG
jgi:hypothetical protein